MVRPPHERPSLIQKVHSKLGHFGIKRTYSLLALRYHWKGMCAQVRHVIARCEQCDRVKTSFSSRQLTLSPLPIQGMFFHWSCDLAGELPHTSKGNVYIMIMIEHFQSGSSLLHCWTSHHITPTMLSYNRSLVGLGLVMSALLIKDKNSQGNSKTYLIMLSLTIARLQGIIPKLMALQRRWFRHERKDFEIFVSLGTKRIGTWPYLTSPWVT